MNYKSEEACRELDPQIYNMKFLKIRDIEHNKKYDFIFRIR